MVNGTSTMNVHASRQLRRRIDVVASPISVGIPSSVRDGLLSNVGRILIGCKCVLYLYDFLDGMKRVYDVWACDIGEDGVYEMNYLYFLDINI